MADLFRAYRKDLQGKLATGQAGEHTYRPALQQQLQALGGKSRMVLNEAKQVQHNAPDFTIQRDGVPIGYVECKDIGTDLDVVERSNQLKRYRAAFNNLLLTDYLEFRWYVGGERRSSVRIGAVSRTGRITAATSEIDPRSFFRRFFELSTPEIRTAAQLAKHMAGKAQLFRDVMASILIEEQGEGRFRAMYEKLKAELIPDLTESAFADIYAQSAAYGLFAARCLTFVNGESTFSKDDALGVPTTRLLNHFFDYIAGNWADPRLTWIVDELAALLAGRWFGAILAEFRGNGKDEDPVVHFYEKFLRQYDETLQLQRGVFYTPTPVVKYIVASVDVLLKGHFDLSDGLADKQMVSHTVEANGKRQEQRVHRVLILDPATGTGTFLRHVIAHIRDHVVARGMAGIWPSYVHEHLFSKLYGFELLVAPRAICHLRLALELQSGSHGVKLDASQRFQVYLTNALAEPSKTGSMLFDPDPVVAEAKGADGVKRDTPLMVIMGNPPYARNSLNKGRWISDLLKGKEGGEVNHESSYYSADGSPIRERQSGSLQDDYVKFIRLAQHKIDQTGEGILAFVTNHAYLTNITFRGMRESLLYSFSEIYVLDLHGNAQQAANVPRGVKDNNVFDIQQGTCIGLFVKRKGGNAGLARVFHADLWGERDLKYRWLSTNDSSSTEWSEVHPRRPWYFLVPPSGTGTFAEEYNRWSSLSSDIMQQWTSAMQTCRNHITIHDSRQALMAFLREFVSMAPEEARITFNTGKDSRDWQVRRAQNAVKETGMSSRLVQPVLYRPYDVRYTYYTHSSRSFICQPVFKVMQHMIHGPNIALVTVRQVAENRFSHVILADKIVPGRLTTSNKGAAYIFPLYLYNGAMGRLTNISSRFVRHAACRLSLLWIPDGRGDGDHTFGPEDLLFYIYACLHSPQYRSRYLWELKVDFPRIPVTDQPKLFWRLVALGDRLGQLHLMREYGSDQPGFPVPGTNIVESVSNRYRDNKVLINRRQYFGSVKEDVWTFMQCGYRPMQKWLKERQGKTLTVDDVFHFSCMHASIAETMQLMKQIDAAIAEHGGWPLE